MRFLLGLLRLCRPLNAGLTGLVVMVGGILALRGGDVSTVLRAAAVVAALGAAGGNAVNDFYDYKIDRVNRPNRPIPSGMVGRASALVWALALLSVGVGLAFSIRIDLGGVALIVAAALWLYSARWKRQPVIGNVAVALCAGTAFIFGAMAVGHIGGGIVPAVFAAMLHFGREIVKDLEDQPGDRAVGARTLPIAAGEEKARLLAGAALSLLAAGTPVPFILKIYNFNYLVSVTVFTAIPLLIVSYYLFRGVEPAAYRRMSITLKAAMVTGLAALFVG